MFGLWWIFIGLIVIGVVTLVTNAIINTVWNHKNNHRGLYPDEWEWGWGIFGGFVISALLILLPFCLLTPKCAHREVVKYSYDYEMVQEVILNGKDLENIRITETILNYNNWLSEAKADKETWRNWSKYYKEDLDSLKPIVIKRNKGEGE